LKKMAVILGVLITITACSFIVKPIAGNFSKEPHLRYSSLSKEAKKMIEESFKGIDFSKYRDVHVHLVGIGDGGSGAWVNPKMREGFHLFERIKYAVYMSASGVEGEKNVDQQYLQRLVKLTKGFPRGAKFHLFAFDKFYNEQGDADLNHTSFYVPNNYMMKVVALHPDVFVPVASIHPYRKDALEKLEFYAKKGIRFLKWLPNAMGIDASHPKSLEFLAKMKELNMVLITHIGEEKAVEGEAFQALGNPLLFRKVLDMGLKVIMAHLGTLGDCKDLDSEKGEMKSCYELFWRLFKDPKYEKNLYADASAITIFSRTKHIHHMISHTDFHHRIIHGSDYPLPAVNILYRTGQYAKLKLIPINEREILNEIYDYNPLVFDFVVKRRLGHEENQFSTKIFEFPEELLKVEPQGPSSKTL